MCRSSICIYTSGTRSIRLLRVFPFIVDNFLPSSFSKLKVILDYWAPCYVAHDVLQVCIVICGVVLMHWMVGYGRA